jgi:hypothetical protein
VNRGSSALVLGIIVALGAGVVWLLSSGGGGSGTSDDPKGDVVVSKGPKAPKGKGLVDLRHGAITVEGGTASFEARVDAVVPEDVDEEAITYRWELIENGQVTWIISANVDVGRTASVLATQHDYRSSTIDDSLPGKLTVQAETVFIELETEDLEDFPSSFEWTLQTELDGDRTTAPSAVATDRIPDEGSLRVGS